MASDQPSRADRARTMLGMEHPAETARIAQPLTLTRPQLVGDLMLALLVGLLSFLGLVDFETLAVSLASVVVLMVAVALRRLRPGLALAVCWFSAFVFMIGRADAGLIYLAMGIVVYSAAAYGNRVHLWAAAISAVLAGALGGTYLALVGSWVYAIQAGGYPSISNIVFISVMITVYLGAAWLIGVAMRFAHAAQSSRSRQRDAETEAERSRRVAALENEKAELARDMHDVIGHSLAVIIAQSDAVRFLPDSDTAGIKRGVLTIGETARKSLGDVRNVLGRIGGMADAPLPEAGLSQLPDLIRGVTAAGANIDFVQLGTGQSLDAQAERVVYRVIQELLTNALKHGQRSGIIVARLRWEPQSLSLSVENPVSDAVALGIVAASEHSVGLSTPNLPGNGIVGMRYRLAELKGSLNLRSPSVTEAIEFLSGTPGAATFTATAIIPTPTISNSIIPTSVKEHSDS